MRAANQANSQEGLTTPRPRTLIRGSVAVAVALAIALSSYGCGASIDRGKVIFSTDMPKAGGGCAPTSQVTTVSSGTSVYATYVFKTQPADETISISVTRDGQTFISNVDLPNTVTKGVDCFANTSDLSATAGWGPGSYHFTVTSDGADSAAGDLVVK